MSRQLGAAGFTSEKGRCLLVNILDSGRSDRVVGCVPDLKASALLTDLNSYIWTNPA
jgi:hypothetical protein